MNVEVQRDGRDIYIVADGVRIARRGHRGTPEAGTWTPLIPAWIVTTPRARRVAKWLAKEVDGGCLEGGPAEAAPAWPDDGRGASFYRVDGWDTPAGG